MVGAPLFNDNLVNTRKDYTYMEPTTGVDTELTGDMHVTVNSHMSGSIHSMGRHVPRLWCFAREEATLACCDILDAL